MIWQKLRLRYGLRWAGRYPRPPAALYLFAASALVVWLALDSVAKAEAQAASVAQHWTSQFAECLNGRWRGITADGTQIACLPAETFNPKRGS